MSDLTPPPGRGASVAFIYLPHGEGGAKTGLDDYLAAGHNVDDLLALAAGVEIYTSERGEGFARFDAGKWKQTQHKPAY